MKMFKRVLKMDAKTVARYNANVLQILKPKQEPVPRLTDKELSKAIKQFKACALNCYNLVSIPLKSGRCCKSALQNFLIKINKLFVIFR